MNRPSPLLPLPPRIYEDERLLIVHKPSGLASAHQAGSELASVESVFESRGVKLTAAHRLDNDTSGLLALAKSPEEHQRLRLLWNRREVRKTYRAVVCSPAGPSALDAGPLPIVIRHPLAHHPKSGRRMIALSGRHPASERQARGKPLEALTRILRVHGRGRAGADGEIQLWDLEIEIETGVMHQIRCHLADAGLAVWGDPIYSSPDTRARVPSARLWLHAWKLELPLHDGALNRSSTTRLALTSALPEDWPKTTR